MVQTMSEIKKTNKNFKRKIPKKVFWPWKVVGGVVVFSVFYKTLKQILRNFSNFKSLKHKQLQ